MRDPLQDSVGKGCRFVFLGQRPRSPSTLTLEIFQRMLSPNRADNLCQVNLGFRACSSWGSGLGISCESELNTEPESALCMLSLSCSGLLGLCRAQLFWGIRAHCIAQHSSSALSLKHHAPIIFLLFNHCCSVFQLKEMMACIFKFVLGQTYFSFDAKQWILSCWFQCMKTKNQILIPVWPVPPLWPGLEVRHEPPAALRRRLWSPFHWGGAGLGTGQKQRSSTRAPQASAIPPAGYFGSHTALATCSEPGCLTL